MSSNGGRMYACVDCNKACIQVMQMKEALLGDLKQSLPTVELPLPQIL